MSLVAIPLAALAGGLTILSPCILPIAPVVLASALTQHKWGPFALAFGLGLSFALVGVVLAIAEAAFNFDSVILKQAGAILMLILGMVMLVPKTFDVFAMATSPLSNWAANRPSLGAGDGLRGQFGIGVLLALIWSPCVGPTLGAAFALASNGQNLVSASLTMLAFAFGASSALIGLSLLLRTTLSSNKAILQSLALHGRTFLAVSIIFVSLITLSGFDEVFGRWVVEASPDWVVRLTTRF